MSGEIITMRYIGDTGCFDGCTYGELYEVKQSDDRPEAYKVLENDLGGTSTLLKEKFVDGRMIV